MQTHHLKLNTHYFDAVLSGEKSFEVRYDDRGYQRGDTIIFYRFGDVKTVGGRKLGYMDSDERIVSPTQDHEHIQNFKCTIGYILTGGHRDGIDPGYVVMAIKLDANS